MKKIIIIICLLFSLNINALELKAKSAILMEPTTKKVLYSLNENEKMAPASMTKIMSMLLVYEQLENNNISLDDDVLISRSAESMGGSQVYLKEGETYKVKELLKSVALSSANDSIVALAEKTYGTVENFVNKMNEKVKELNLENTNFENPHGLDSVNHYSTSFDMAIIASELLKYEEVLKYTSVYEDYFKRNDGSSIWMVNTNKLVRTYPGVDGLKTGYTLNAGYCLTATMKKNNLRLVSVVMNESSIEDRSSDTVNLLNYGFNYFKANTLKNKNDIIGNIKINKGKTNLDVTLENDIVILNKNDDIIKEYNFKVETYNLTAPIKKNDKVGIIYTYDSEKNLLNTTNLIAFHDVNKANIFDYMLKNIKYIITFNKD